ncbi:MAG: M15 family metallopeptidase [Mycobacteriales bacterium]
MSARSAGLRAGTSALASLALLTSCAAHPAARAAAPPTPLAGSASPSPVATNRASPTPTPTPPAACGAPQPAGIQTLALPGGRQTLLAVPPGDTGHRRLALIIAYHGYAETPQDMVTESGLAARGEAAGVLVAFPLGTGNPLAWDFPGDIGPNDVAFTATLMARLDSDYCADPTHTVLTGLSDGGLMAITAGCALYRQVSAVLVVAANRYPPPDCRVPLVAVHGDADPFDPFHGGYDSRPGYGGPLPATTTAAADFAGQRGCTSATHAPLAPTVTATVYAGCGVTLVTIHGGGHTWPGGPPEPASRGVTSQAYDATGAVLALATGRASAATPAFTATTTPVSAADLPYSWHPGCPVAPEQLRALHLPYFGFDGLAHQGTLIVNGTAVPVLSAVFADLYRSLFPLRSMIPIDAFRASDNASSAADNTAAFNCRPAVASGSPSWSEYAYGLAVDVNPVENPYLDQGRVIPADGAPYANRSLDLPGMAVAGGTLVEDFLRNGWHWGGVWSTPDYQHFSVNGR